MPVEMTWAVVTVTKVLLDRSTCLYLIDEEIVTEIKRALSNITQLVGCMAGLYLTTESSS